AQRPQVGGPAATPAQARAAGRGGRSPRLPGNAQRRADGGADAGDSDARRLHAQLQGSHSHDGRDFGSFQVGCEPAGGEASQAEVEALLSRRFDELKVLVIYIDGLLFGDYTMIGAVGVDSEGNKHVLGIREGATENSTVVKELLED